MYRYLVLRDGDECAICHRAPTALNNQTPNATDTKPTAQNTLDIDHIDGNTRNGDPDNLRLLCRTCNVSIANKGHNPQALRSAKREREREGGQPATRIAREDANYRDGSPEMQANLIYEVPFRRWIMAQVTKHGHYDRAAAINEGAELVGCSPLTTTRYLAKLTSPSGPLADTKDLLGHKLITLKPHLY